MSSQLASDNFKVAARLTQLQTLLRQGQYDEIVDIWKHVNLSGGERADPPHQVYELFQEILNADECHYRDAVSKHGEKLANNLS